MSGAMNDLYSFIEYAESLLSNGGSDLSPEQCLALYRAEELQQSVTAVKDALDAIRNGDVGVTREQFHREFRRRNKLPTDG